MSSFVSPLVVQFVGWYLVIQLLTLIALPLTMRVLGRLPDHGYAFAKSVGVLAVGVVFWLGYSYGLLQHNAGSAWLSVGIVAAISLAAGRGVLFDRRQRRRSALRWRYILLIELIFLAGFAVWAMVRAYDPAINHTEQPMDLMFMNSIWVSADYPPQDAWLSGYAISYYYLGYWLLTLLARLAGQSPEIAYNIGQANWYGFLLIGSFGLVYNLLARPDPDTPNPDTPNPDTPDPDTTEGVQDVESPPRLTSQGLSRGAVAGGMLAALWVAVAGNLQVIFEWLYAHGIRLNGLLGWFDVRNFPENAQVTNQWFIDSGWWWWRSSRVIRDLDLSGNHVEVIDEFPAFSYVLGDNHPHVMAMPLVLLVIALALAHLLPPRHADARTRAEDAASNDESPWRPAGWVHWTRRAAGGSVGMVATVVATGALIFLNTWDFPPYWLLLVLVAAFVAMDSAVLAGESGRAIRRRGVVMMAATGGLLVVGTVAIYLPYFLTAQSQAGGLLPNLFNPTRLPQFLLMFGAALPALVALILPAWPRLRPSLGASALALLLVYGAPVAFLSATTWMGLMTDSGRTALARMALPPGAPSHLPFILERWSSEPWTFLLTGGLLALVGTLIWTQAVRVVAGARVEARNELFALLLAGIGLLLVFAPEWIYLRDNFGTRMNTIFKFYYQAWLLFALAGSYAVVTSVRRLGRTSTAHHWVAAGLSVSTVALVTASLIFMPAGAYSKTRGFSGAPTFDGTAYIRDGSPAEWRAAAWVRDNVAPDALVLEGKGASYRAETSRISTTTGRPTLLGWDGHESQWRGRAFGRMAAGRTEALDLIYRSGGPSEIAAALERWQIDYVYVGPMERNQYGITPGSEARLAQSMELVFDEGDVRIYRRRGPVEIGAAP